MKIGIMQPYFFPYIGYFQLIDACDAFLVYGNVTFRKSTWITRNRLRKPTNGESYFITCPVTGASSSRLIRDINLVNDTTWAARLLSQIRHDYSKYAYFDNLWDILSRILTQPDENLISFHVKTIRELCTYMNITTPIIWDDSRFYEIENALKIENTEIPNMSARVVKICRALNADGYMNPSGGVDLYSKDLLRKHDIDLSFIEPMPESIAAQQSHSIIDVLMRFGPEQTNALLSQRRIF